MKKVLCLALCLFMVLPALVGCSSGFLLGDSNAATAKTVTITTIREEGTTDEAIAMVQAAINSLTEKEYNTHVVLNMIPAAEYEAYVYERSERNFLNGIGGEAEEEEEGTEKTSEKTNEKDQPESFTSEGATYTYAANGDLMVYDQYHRAHTVYPDVKEDQLDIVLIPNVDFYNKLIRGYVETVEETGGEITNSYLQDVGSATLMGEYGTLLKKYVASYDLSALFHLGRAGRTYAIPNNYFYDSYRYIVLNKALFDKYQYDPTTVTGLGDVAEFVRDVVANGDTGTPLYNYAGYSWISYYNFPSMLSLRRANSYTYDVVLKVVNNLSVNDYCRTLDLLNELREAGYTWSDSEAVSPESLKNEDFAVALMDGDPMTAKEMGDDYYTVVVNRPTLNDDMYAGMYGISDGCEDPRRAMEILTLLSTDKNIVNLLAYGIEGTHYDLNADGMVVNRSGDYSMNIRYVGNAFLLRQSEDMDEKLLKYSADEWALAKEHNRALTPNPYAGFGIVGNEEIDAQIAGFREASDSILSRIDKYDEFKASADYATYMAGEDHATYVQENGTDPDDFPYLEYLNMLKMELERNESYKAINKAGITGQYNSPAQQYSDYFLVVYPR